MKKRKYGSMNITKEVVKNLITKISENYMDEYKSNYIENIYEYTKKA
jgi:hypothetical protein